MPSVDGYDELGNLAYSGSTDAVDNPLGIGFGPAWRRFITAGVYNSDFVNPPPDTTQTLDNVNNPLPYWSFVSSGQATAQVVADAASASGSVLRFTIGTVGDASDQAYIEQVVPINGSRGQSYCYKITACVRTPAAVSALEVFMTTVFLRNDGVTTTGSAYTSKATTTALGANTTVDAVSSTLINGDARTPADAYYMRVQVGFRRGSAATSVSGTVDLCEVRAEVGISTTMLPDRDGTFSPGALFQGSGILQLEANSFSLPSGATPMIVLDGSTTGNVQIFASNADLGGLVYNGSSLRFPNANTLADITGRITASGDLRGNLIITTSKSGSPSDADFTGAAINGGLVVDVLNNKIWARTGTTTWKGVAIAGLSVPREERRCPRCLRLLKVGDVLAPIVNEYQGDRARHALYAHASHPWRWRLARRLGLARDHTGWYTAAIRRVEARKIVAAVEAQLLAEREASVDTGQRT